jgi:hypothetical protein
MQLCFFLCLQAAHDHFLNMITFPIQRRNAPPPSFLDVLRCVCDLRNNPSSERQSQRRPLDCTQRSLIATSTAEQTPTMMTHPYTQGRNSETRADSGLQTKKERAGRFASRSGMTCRRVSAVPAMCAARFCNNSPFRWHQDVKEKVS